MRVHGDQADEPSDNDGYNIRECYSVEGDWFYVSEWADFEKPKGRHWKIERVILWAIRTGDADQLVGIDRRGLPALEPDPDCDDFFVKGSDISPNGKTWDEIYRSIIPDKEMHCDITHVFKKPRRRRVRETDKEPQPSRPDTTGT